MFFTASNGSVNYSKSPLIGQNPVILIHMENFEHFVNEIKFASNGLFLLSKSGCRDNGV